MLANICEFPKPIDLNYAFCDNREKETIAYDYIIEFLETNTTFTIDDFNEDQLVQLALCVLQQIDIFDIIDPKFTYEEMFNYRTLRILSMIKKRNRFININDNLVDDLRKKSLNRNYLYEF